MDWQHFEFCSFCWYKLQIQRQFLIQLTFLWCTLQYKQFSNQSKISVQSSQVNFTEAWAKKKSPKDLLIKGTGKGKHFECMQCCAVHRLFFYQFFFPHVSLFFLGYYLQLASCGCVRMKFEAHSQLTLVSSALTSSVICTALSILSWVFHNNTLLLEE